MLRLHAGHGEIVSNLITRSRQYAAIHSDSFRQGWPVWLVSLVTLLNGAWSISSILLTRLPQRVQYFLPFGVFHWTRSLTLVLGFILLYLSFHLFQRRRAAWWVAVFAAGIEVIGHAVHLSTWYTALPQAVTFTLLLFFRDRFSVRSESRNIRLGLLLLFGSLLVSLLYGTFGFWKLSQRDFGITFSLQDGLVRSLRQFLLLGNSDLIPVTRQAGWFLQSLDILGIVAAGFAMYSLFRPIVFRFIQLPQERARAAAIIEKYGKSTFDYFKTWPDKSFYFSPGRESFISYRMVGGVAFCLADPVGPDADRDIIVKSFLQFCTQNGWSAAFMMPDDHTAYSQYGLSLFRVGEEAIIDLEQFAAHANETYHFKRVRKKFEKDGYRIERYKPPVPRQIQDEAMQVSKLWLTLPHHREYGFFQGRFERGYIEKCTLCALRNAKGEMVAFINEVPSYRPGEAAFDLMRHLPGTHWGTMDYLFAQMMLLQKSEGFRTFNFAVAPFVGVGNRPDATLTEKAVNQIFERLDWFLHSKGIKQYKLKFEPQWRDVYVVYQGGPMGLLRVALNVNRIL
jgi:phosphatidylglycerol lysyltransferase